MTAGALFSAGAIGIIVLGTAAIAAISLTLFIILLTRIAAPPGQPAAKRANTA